MIPLSQGSSTVVARHTSTILIFTARWEIWLRPVSSGKIAERTAVEGTFAQIPGNIQNSTRLRGRIPVILSL